MLRSSSILSAWTEKHSWTGKHSSSSLSCTGKVTAGHNWCHWDGRINLLISFKASSYVIGVCLLLFQIFSFVFKIIHAVFLFFFFLCSPLQSIESLNCTVILFQMWWAWRLKTTSILSLGVCCISPLLQSLWAIKFMDYSIINLLIQKQTFIASRDSISRTHAQNRDLVCCSVTQVPQ